MEGAHGSETDYSRRGAVRQSGSPAVRQSGSPAVRQDGGEPNWKNRTIWTKDNLLVLRGMNSACVDLIYLDPPFKSNQDYAAPIGSPAQGAEFKDIWKLDDVDEAWHGEIAEREPRLYAIIDAAGVAHGKSMKAYLIMMAMRLLEMRRILKPVGSIYLHCDDAAGHYLKMLMDSLFGPSAFRNAITWRRAVSHNDPGRYGRISDYLLFYTASDDYIWNDVRERQDGEKLRKAFPSTDEKGRRYRADNLTGPAHGQSGGESARPWRGYDVASRGRVWSAPKTGTYADYIEECWIPGYKAVGGVHARLDALDAAGLIHHPKRGFWPGLKRYAEADAGKPLQDIIYTPTGLTNYSGTEGLGYPTQKPLALLDLIIRASSNPGDMVLDPFCGCATALVAADRLNRQWAGIDESPLAAKLVKKRLLDDAPQGPDKGTRSLLHEVHHRTDIPHRSEHWLEYHPSTYKHTLFGKQEGKCNGCLMIFPFRNFTIDHIVPQARGGQDNFDNLQLLCGACNSAKGTGTHEQLVAKLRREGIRA